jgi:hypothetical protein
MECNESGGWSFLARKGKYLCVDDPSYLIKASRENKDQWETFQIEFQNEPKLQDQINAISPGGTVYLKEGVYRGTAAIDKPVNIIGAGSGRTIVDGDNKESVFTIGKTDSNIDVKLTGMTIQGGQNIFGGGIYNSGRLAVKDSTITKNAAEMGGGVYGSAGILTLDNCQITQNEATAFGRGVSGYKGPTTIHACSIKGNIALNGGGIYEEEGELVVADSSVQDNKATAEGGGISIVRGTALVKLSNIVNNRAIKGGGVWRLDSPLHFEGGSISGNYPDQVYPPY